jgi:hypothetical protein
MTAMIVASSATPSSWMENLVDVRGRSQLAEADALPMAQSSFNRVSDFALSQG